MPILSSHVPVPGFTYPKPGPGAPVRPVRVTFVDVNTDQIIGNITIHLDADCSIEDEIRIETLVRSDQTGHTVFAITDTGEHCIVTPVYSSLLP